MSSSSYAIPILEEEMAAAQEALTWGTSPDLYLSYGMVAMKGRRPVLTDAVVAAPSFTFLTPPVGLDIFAVLDGRGLGAAAAAAAAGGESERLLALMRDALAWQVNLELCSDSPRFLDGTSRDGWWATTLTEAFRAFHEEFAACSQGEHGVDAPAAATAIVALVLERHLVIGNCGACSKAVLSRDGELVELGSDSQHMVHAQANRRGDENKSMDTAGGGRVAEATSKLATAVSAGSSAAPAPAPVAAGVVDVVVVEREARDEFLILASAALWDKVTPAAACAHVRRRLGRISRITMPWETRITDTEDLPTLLAEELSKKAVHAGSRDNVSVVLVVFSDFSGLQGTRAGCQQVC